MKTIFGILVAVTLMHGTSPQEAAEITNRASRSYTQSHYAEAEALYRQAVDAWTALGPQEKHNRAVALRELGSLLRATGRDVESESLLQEALRDLEPGPDASRTLWTLATVYRSRGDLEKAESFALRAIAMVQGRNRQAPRMVLASIYAEQRRYAEAEKILRAEDEDADDVLRTGIYNNLAHIALASGRYHEAEEFSRKALDVGTSALPAQHPAIAAAWNSLAQACRFQGDYAAAENAYRESIARWEKAFGPAHANVARVTMNLAALYHERGREAGAEILYRKAAEILDQTYGGDHLMALIARNELSDVLRAQGRFTEAERLGSASLAGIQKSVSAGDPRLAQALWNRMRLLRDTGKTKEAGLLASRLKQAAAAAAIPGSGADRGADRIPGGF